MLVRGEVNENWPSQITEFVTQVSRLRQRYTELHTEETELPLRMQVSVSFIADSLLSYLHLIAFIMC